MVDIDEFIDLFRRMQMPHYEEARRKFDDPDALTAILGSLDAYLYDPDRLRQLAVGKISPVE